MILLRRFDPAECRVECRVEYQKIGSSDTYGIIAGLVLEHGHAYGPMILLCFLDVFCFDRA